MIDETASKRGRTMGLYTELQTLGEELIQRFHAPPPDGEDYAAGYYLEVAEHLRLALYLYRPWLIPD